MPRPKIRRRTSGGLGGSQPDHKGAYRDARKKCAVNKSRQRCAIMKTPLLKHTGPTKSGGGPTFQSNQTGDWARGRTNTKSNRISTEKNNRKAHVDHDSQRPKTFPDYHKPTTLHHRPARLTFLRLFRWACFFRAFLAFRNFASTNPAALSNPRAQMGGPRPNCPVPRLPTKPGIIRPLGGSAGPNGMSFSKNPHLPKRFGGGNAQHSSAGLGLSSYHVWFYKR